MVKVESSVADRPGARATIPGRGWLGAIGEAVRLAVAVAAADDAGEAGVLAPVIDEPGEALVDLGAVSVSFVVQRS
ncbi:hypothetical protein [Streptomyces fumanus]|uniref:hypothetical protein n=1 Tax=Streptomyces fumanus TaxID=67302 RepID=UPI00340A0CDC